MRQFLVATSCVIGVAACSSMQASNVEQLSEAAGPAYRQLFASDAAERCGGAHAIASLRPVEEPTVRRLVRLLTDDAKFEESDWNGHVWTFTPADCAEDALIRVGEPAVTHVIPLARHSDATVRSRAVAVLGRSQDPRAVEPLLAAFRDRDADVRRTAVLWAGNSDPRFFDAYVRPRDAGQLRALGKIGDARAYDTLISCLQGANFVTRKQAVEALLGLGDPRAADSIRPLLNDPQPAVRESAQKALAVWGTRMEL